MLGPNPSGERAARGDERVNFVMRSEAIRPPGAAGRGNQADCVACTILPLSASTAFVCIWEMRDSVTCSTFPI